MERKPNIRQNPTFYPKYPKSVPQVYNKNLPKIDDIFGKFITSEYSEILEVINSGEVLNFRNKEGKTLIHAVINNESGISETNKLSLIKELVNKNVSINAMDEYNRNALHYASEKGYASIIEYLISIGCDKKLIDNEGNAPIHIFVNKFIMDCKDKLYDPLNKLKNITESPEFNKVNENIKSNLMAEILNDFGEPQIQTLINFVKKIIEANKYFNEKNINNIFNEKNKDFLNIFKKITTEKNLPSNLNELVKENVLGLENDVKGLYDDLNTVEYENNFDDLLEKLKQQSKINQDNINLVLKNIYSEINTKSFKSIISAYNNNYLTIDKLFKSSYYLFHLTFSPIRPYENTLDIPTNIYYPTLFQVQNPPYGAHLPPIFDTGNVFNLGYNNNNYQNSCGSVNLPNNKHLSDSGIPIYNILHNGANFDDRYNTLMCNNEWISDDFRDNTFDQRQANVILDSNNKFTNKMLIYDINGNVFNSSHSAEILNFITQDLTLKNNDENSKIYFNYTDIDIAYLRDTFFNESEHLNWNLKWFDENKIKNLFLLKTEKRFLINNQNFNSIDLPYHSEFLLSKFPKKFSTNEKINKEINQENLDKIKILMNNNDNNINLDDKYIISDLNNILKTNYYFRCTGKTPIPRCPTPNTTELQNELSELETELINQLQPRENPLDHQCAIDRPRPDYMTLKDLLNEKNEVLAGLLQDLNNNLDINQNNFPLNDKIVRTYVIKKVLENNYPNGFGDEINNLKLNGFDRVNKYGNISFIFNYIYQCIHLVNTIIPSEINNQIYIQPFSIYFNIEILNQIHHILVSLLINLGLLYDIINTKFNFDKFSESFAKLKTIYQNIIGGENYSDYSKNIFKEFFNFIIEDVEISYEEFATYHRSKKYLEDFEKIYESVLKLFNHMNELRENFNKSQSLVYLIKFVEMLKTGDNQQINDFMFNKVDVDFKSGFPNKFIDFKEKYIKGSEIGNPNNIDMKQIITELYPYYYPYNYNKIYNITNLKGGINKFVSFRPDIEITKRKNLTWDCKTKKTMYIKYPLKIGEYKFNYVILRMDMDNPRINNYVIINLKNNIVNPQKISRIKKAKYKFGYPFLRRIPDTVNPANPTSLNRFVGYISDKKKYNDLYFKDSDNLFDMQINDMAPYQNLYIINDNDFVIDTNLDINSLSLISLLNCKELINSIIIKITDLIKNNGKEYFDADLEGVVEKNLLDKEDKNNCRIIFEQIRTNPEIKDSIILDIVQQIINMLIKSNSNIELIEISRKYFDDIIKSNGKFKIEYPNVKLNIEDELESIIKKKSKILSTILPTSVSNIDSQTMFSKSNYIKIIDDKCVDMNMVDKVIKMNMRIEDINGNTILNKLISQYNIYGIQKIIQFDKELKTYKNSRGENSLEFTLNLIKSIQSDYVSNIDLRIKQYSEVLLNEMNENKREKYKELSIDPEQNMVNNLLKMCIYMFNEFIWVKMIGFPNGWTSDDKIKINKILNIDPQKESLIINTFSSDDENELTSSSKTRINEKIKDEFIKGIEDEICNIKNKIEQLSNPATSSSLIKNTTSLIAGYRNQIAQKEAELDIFRQEGSTKITAINYNIKQKIDNYTNDLINNNNSIDYEKYNELVEQIILNYFDVIKILNQKVANSDTSKDKTISDSQISLLSLKPNIIVDKSNLVNLKNYYEKIIDKLYAEYNDLDKYEDSDYNTVNYSMLSIIKINIINVMAEELTKLLIEYIRNNYDSEFITALNSDLTTNYTSLHDKLFGLIKNYLSSSMNEKLGTTNPDKQVNLDIIKTRLVKSIFTSFGLTLELEGEELDEIVTMLNFYSDISDNMSLHAYTEMVKLLVNLKKVGLLISIYNLLDN